MDLDEKMGGTKSRVGYPRPTMVATVHQLQTLQTGRARKKSRACEKYQTTEAEGYRSRVSVSKEVEKPASLQERLWISYAGVSV